VAKQGQHKNDRQDSNVSRGNNNPAKSMTITAGAPKKEETYAEQAREHENTDKQAQQQQNDWLENTHRENRTPDGELLRTAGRSGSRHASAAQTTDEGQTGPGGEKGSQIPERFRADLYGRSSGVGNDPAATREEWDEAIAASDIKDIYRRLPDWTHDDLAALPVLPEGTALQQGATYLDLQNPMRGEFKAIGAMTAGPENYFVPKKLTDYQTWDRLLDYARSTMR
jgi:hypothetical protein